MKSLSLWAALAALVLALATPSFALAAPATFDVVDVAVHADGAEAVLLVSGTLPDSAPLPAEVRLAVPAGAKLQWAGEILGGAPDQDPEVEYSVESRDGLDIYSFSMKSSRTAQIEVVPTGLVTPGPNGQRSNLSFTPVDKVRQVRLNFLLPTTASVLTPAEGAVMSAGPEGYSYYVRTIDQPAVGKPVTLAFDYTPGAPQNASQGAGAPASSTSDSVALAVVLAVAVAAFGVFGYAVVRKARSRPASHQVQTKAPKKAVRADVTEAKQKVVVAREEDDEDTVEAGSARNGRKSAYVLTGVVMVVAVIAGIALGSGGKAAVVGDVATLQIAQVDTCTTADIPLRVPQGGDLDRDVNDILGALKSVTGVGNASLYLKESRLEVAFCDSNTSEELIRAALAPTGYLAEQASQP